MSSHANFKRGHMSEGAYVLQSYSVVNCNSCASSVFCIFLYYVLRNWYYFSDIHQQNSDSGTQANSEKPTLIFHKTLCHQM